MPDMSDDILKKKKEAEEQEGYTFVSFTYLFFSHYIL